VVVELRGEAYPGQVAPVYVDAFEEPGRLLYRFDAVVRNRGGTLDLFRDPGTGAAMQAVWAGGVPSEAPNPNRPPSGSGASLIALAGARFAYVYEKTHQHWHFFSAARYELDGAAGRVSDKVGFCLFDGFGDAGGDPLYFPPDFRGSGTQTWCGFDHPHGSFVRMGLSPGAADRYASQREFQWIDVSGLRPGAYTLRATANPDGSIVESSIANNVLREPRTIPGVLAAPATVERDGPSHVDVALSGEIVAPHIPARRAADCTPVATSEACYVRTEPAGQLRFRITRPPRHGTVAITSAAGLSATARYTAAEGSTEADSFEYTATDARGLESPPAVVTIHPPAASTPASATVTPLPPAADSPPRPLLAGLTLTRRGNRHYALLRLRAPARVTGRLERRVPRSRRTTPSGRRTTAASRYQLVRRLRPRRLVSGRRTIALGRLPAGRYRLRLRFAADDGRRLSVARRFRVAR
jgi:hypothetical protein